MLNGVTTHRSLLRHPCLSKQVVLLQKTTLEFQIFRVQILPLADISIGSLGNNQSPIMFHCDKICISYWLFHNG